MNKSDWNVIGKPIVVLLTICLICSAALAGANQLTKPIIDAQKASAANAAYLEVLPQADVFEEITEFETSNVEKVLKAANGAGWVVQASAKGFGGDVPAVVGFDAEGTIVGLKFMENAETAGYGQKLVDGSEAGTAFHDQIIGLAGEVTLGTDVDGISGATVSSKAAVAAVNTAISCFNEVALGAAAVVEEPEMTMDEVIASFLGGQPAAIETPEGLDAAYQNGDTTVLVATQMGYTHDGYGDPEPLTVVVAFDAAGAITNIWVDASHQTPGIGDAVAEDSFIGQYIGINGEDALGDVDAISGATESSVGVKKAVRLCVQYMVAQTGDATADSAASNPAADSAAQA